jgi:hypothetical protein
VVVCAGVGCKVSRCWALGFGVGVGAGAALFVVGVLNGAYSFRGKLKIHCVEWLARILRISGPINYYLLLFFWSLGYSRPLIIFRWY